ncbi:MAG TPA: EAL domain-containing protein [Arenimonas sp.]
MGRFPRACLLLALTFLAQGASAAGTREVRVGVYDNPPKLLLDKQGQASGILGDLLAQVAREEGWILRPVACQWETCLALLEAGDLDLLPDVAHTDERARRFAMHEVPALRSWSQVYTRPGLQLESVLELDGQRVAVLAGSVQQTYLGEAAHDFGLDVDWLVVDSMDAALAATAAGEADAMATNHFFGAQFASERGLGETPILFDPSRLYYASRRGANADLLRAIDLHLVRWQGRADSPYFATLRQWGAPAAEPGLPSYVYWVFAGAGGLFLLALAGIGLLRREVGNKTRSLRASEQRLATILDSVDAHIYIKDARLRYRYVNRRVAQLFGMKAADIVGRGDEDFFDQATVEELRKNDLKVVRDGQRLALEEINRLRGDGAIEHAYLSVKIPLPGPDGKVDALCGISTEITDQYAMRQEIERLALYDPLTQLPNRKHFLERLRTAIAGSQRDGSAGALVVLNLDRFKELNDTRGHQAGDEWLRQVTLRLRPLLGEGQSLARLGADEFGLLIEGLPPSPAGAHKQAAALGQRVLDAISVPGDVAGQRYHGTASLGATLFGGTEATADEVLRHADLALSEAKAAGGNRVRHFMAQMQEAAAARASLEADLRDGLERGEFLLHYQPQVDGDGKLLGLEALVRWQHPRRGLVPPGSFIPLAEASGLIVPLGDWVLHQAIGQLKQLAARPQTAGLRIAVNVSARQLRQPDFVPGVLAALADSGLPAGRLELELTESELVADVEQAIARLKALREGGVRIALDDFGTGYSALNYVKRLPLDMLKIDTSFVRDLLVDPNDMAIVRTIISLGQSLGLEVLAEGVEDPAQRDVLHEIGCRQFQGYHFSRPRPIADLQDWLA